MLESHKIRVAIIDDKPEFIKNLAEYLLFIPDVEICGTATKYKQAESLLLKEHPNLVFLDIEMPCKNGFQLLNEMRSQGCNFSVIFYTAYDKYMLKALRESAFDYILKPVEEKDVKAAIERFRKQQKEHENSQTLPLFIGAAGMPETVALPTLKGISFVDAKRIVLFRSICKNAWEALLLDSNTMKMGKNTNAGKILKLFADKNFVQISQSCIVNLNYLSTVEFKTRNCILLPPFDHLELKISRIYLTKLRNTYQGL